MTLPSFYDCRRCGLRRTATEVGEAGAACPRCGSRQMKAICPPEYEPPTKWEADEEKDGPDELR